MINSIKGLLTYTAIVFVASALYFVYVYTTYPPIPERETFLSEIGEGVGEVGLWALLFIYSRTILKLLMGKGAIAKRILPNHSSPASASMLEHVFGFLDRTHVYVGIATVAVLLLHIALMGLPMNILFFPAILGLVVWQGLFGMFLTWRYSPKELVKFSYFVHAQFFTGILIGIFSLLGHLLIED
ncbi:MAG: hypothetical protein MRJ96_15060 [Nitrospirales bacterium]|nr:hypothetical protein [Nitrospira sp.]MDR4502761.1 hypothetical protein [Nitrospirales bacterium]